MHEYDTALKVLLRSATGSALRQVVGVDVSRWLDTELPQVESRRADLLGATADGELVHVELQASNDPNMAIRMAEYGLRIFHQQKRFPMQIALYVGEAEMRMADSINEPHGSGKPTFAFEYTLMDIRELDAAALLASSHIEDNLLAVLTRLPDRIDTVRQILSRIAKLEEPARRDAFARFLIISGLRRLAPAIEEEAKKMPILNDILDHEVIGPAIRQGIQQGLQQGREEGRQEGRQEGGQKVIRRLLEKRFGTIPTWAATRLQAMSESELEELAIRILDVARLEDLFQ